MTRRVAFGITALTLIAAFLGLAGVHGTPADAGGGTRVRLLPTASEVEYGDGSFTLRIEISDLNHHGKIPYDDDDDGEPDRFERSDGLGAFEIRMSFNPGVIEVQDAEEEDFLGSTGRDTQCFDQEPELGQYAFGCVSTGSDVGAQGSGRLATVTLKPLANGTTYLALESNLAGPLGDTIDLVTDGGIVKVNEAPKTAPDPEPGDPSGFGRGSNPAGGGTLGDASVPDGNPGPGATGGAGGGSGRPGIGRAGTGYESRGTSTLPLALGGSLAVAGVALLFAGSRLAARGRRR
ncbi:MAG: cohesin domain-containing protein [Dehalococcoidia bacterium]|nr:cohesin domain-containing protein [Dehalococcoidia bacterium]